VVTEKLIKPISHMVWEELWPSPKLLVPLLLEMVAGAVRKSKSDIALSVYRMTRPHWPFHHLADSGAGLSEFPIFAISFTAHLRLSVHMHSNDLWLQSPSRLDMMVVAQLNFMGSN